jgi:hypothetical protein
MPKAAVPYKDERPCPGDTEELSALVACRRAISEYVKLIGKLRSDLAASRVLLARQDKWVDQLRSENEALRSRLPGP